MWTGNTDVLTQQSPRNYMFEDKVFILDSITAENCAYLIGDLTNFVLNAENQGKCLTFMINSPGGEVNVMMNIIGLIKLAKLYDIDVQTFVLGEAGSAASLIAVQGDRRFMSNIATHFVHFGTVYSTTNKHSEIEKIYKQTTEYAANMRDLYISACGGKLTTEALMKIQSDERGYLSARECLKYGLCDFIIENELDKKQQEEQERLDFEDEFLKQRKLIKKSKKGSN